MKSFCSLLAAAAVLAVGVSGTNTISFKSGSTTTVPALPITSPLTVYTLYTDTATNGKSSQISLSPILTGTTLTCASTTLNACTMDGSKKSNILQTSYTFTISYFTFQNGLGVTSSAGALVVGSATSTTALTATVSFCVFNTNSGAGAAGAVLVSGSSSVLTVTSCEFNSNTATATGAMGGKKKKDLPYHKYLKKIVTCKLPISSLFMYLHAAT